MKTFLLNKLHIDTLYASVRVASDISEQAFFQKAVCELLDERCLCMRILGKSIYLHQLRR